MSKKTNAEKQMAKRKHFRHPRGVKRKRVANPAISERDEKARWLESLNSLVDISLGWMFVDALRKTGLRDKLIDLLFGEPALPPQGGSTKEEKDSK